jgi:hypothetical protein
MRSNFSLKIRQFRPNLRAHSAWNIFLVGKVELSLNQRSCTNELLSPGFVKRRQMAICMFHSQPALHFCLGNHQVSQTFDLNEIKFAILERSTGELSSFSQSATRF